MQQSVTNCAGSTAAGDQNRAIRSLWGCPLQTGAGQISTLQGVRTTRLKQNPLMAALVLLGALCLFLGACGSSDEPSLADEAAPQSASADSGDGGSTDGGSGDSGDSDDGGAEAPAPSPNEALPVGPPPSTASNEPGDTSAPFTLVTEEPPLVLPEDRPVAAIDDDLPVGPPAVPAQEDAPLPVGPPPATPADTGGSADAGTDDGADAGLDDGADDGAAAGDDDNAEMPTRSDEPRGLARLIQEAKARA